MKIKINKSHGLSELQAEGKNLQLGYFDDESSFCKIKLKTLERIVNSRDGQYYSNQCESIDNYAKDIKKLVKNLKENIKILEKSITELDEVKNSKEFKELKNG